MHEKQWQSHFGLPNQMEYSRGIKWNEFRAHRALS